MANYCRHYFEPCCFSTFHMEHRSSSQPIWKMLNYSQYKVNHFPKGVLQMTVWQLGGDGSQIHNYLEFLSACRDLWQAGCIPFWGMWGKRRGLLSLTCRLNAISARKLLSESMYLLWAVRNDRGEEILKQSSFLLCASLYVLVAVVDNTDTVSPHRLVFHWCWFWISFVQIGQMLCENSPPLFLRCYHTLWLIIYTLTETSSWACDISITPSNLFILLIIIWSIGIRKLIADLKEQFIFFLKAYWVNIISAYNNFFIARNICCVFNTTHNCGYWLQTHWLLTAVIVVAV